MANKENFKKNDEFSINDFFTLSQKLKNIYPLILSVYSKKFSKEFNLSKAFYSHYLNDGLQSITYLFFYKFLKNQKNINYNNFSINDLNFSITPLSSAERDDKLKSVLFMQKIDKIFGLSYNYSDFPDLEIPRENLFQKKNYKNHLFDNTLINKIIIKFNKLVTLFTKIIFKKRNIFFSMANDDENFWRYHFFLFSNISLPPIWEQKKIEINKSLRDNIFKLDDLDNIIELETFLQSYNIEKKTHKPILNLLVNFYKYLLPVQMIEGSKENYNAVKQIILKHDPNFIICGNGSNFYNDAICGYAESNSIKFLKSQHGGFYGYLDHTRWIINELQNANIFITWGWQNLKEISKNQRLKLIPLPSPWLSLRKKLISKYKLNFYENKIDVLYLTQNVKYFDVMPYNLSFINLDILPNYKKNFLDITSRLGDYKLSFLVKYFDIASFNLLYDSHLKLKNSYNNLYKVNENFDKGLSKNILSKVKLIVFDHPGTGFLECIASGIPTIIFWNRSYSKELKESEIYFKKLEKIGIIHNNIDSFTEEILNYLKFPKEWFETKSKLEEFINFKNTYCLSHDIWWKDWKNYFEKIKNE